MFTRSYFPAVYFSPEYFPFPISGTGVAYFRSIGESVGVPTDLVSRNYVGLRSIVEATTLSDSVARQRAAYRAATDSVSALTDLVMRLEAASRTVVESLPLGTESITRATVTNRSLSESSAISDQVSRVYGAPRSLSESMPAVTDSTSRLVKFPRTISELVAVPLELIGRIFYGSRNVTEQTLLLEDVIARYIRVAHPGSGIAYLSNAKNNEGYRVSGLQGTTVHQITFLKNKSGSGFPKQDID